MGQPWHFCRIFWIFIGIVLFTAVGCGGKSFDPTPPDDMKPGPGVFSGEKGEFTVYDSKATARDKEAAAASESDSRKAEPSGSAAAGAAAQSDEAREFEEFQRWKQDKAAFEEFQRWKQSEQGSQEYREFQEWQKWREYKKWQEGQKPAP